MKKRLSVALAFILLLTIVMSVWVEQAQRLSVGEQAASSIQPTPLSSAEKIPPHPNLVFVDFFAGY
jgi:hypothetical protein